MKTCRFKVVVEPDEDAGGHTAWFAHCSALDAVCGATSGRAKEEALRHINEAVCMIVQEYIEDGKAFPEGPRDAVEVERVSHAEGRSVTVAPHRAPTPFRRALP